MTTSVFTTGRTLNVVIASDREAFTRDLAESLRAHGHNPIVQDSGGSALDALSSGADAILVDTNLPGVDWEQVRSALGASRTSVPEPIDAIERRHIAATLRFTGGNRRNAAQLLGIARSTLLAKIRKYGLDRE